MEYGPILPIPRNPLVNLSNAFEVINLLFVSKYR
jgi:hypothetical protein